MFKKKSIWKKWFKPIRNILKIKKERLLKRSNEKQSFLKKETKGTNNQCYKKSKRRSKKGKTNGSET